jgi:hypothetical protein
LGRYAPPYIRKFPNYALIRSQSDKTKGYSESNLIENLHAYPDLRVWTYIKDRTIQIIGIGVKSVFQIPFIDALPFGAILAATHPVALGVIFKKFPIPHRLNVIIEGESLFNVQRESLLLMLLKVLFSQAPLFPCLT